MGKEYQTKTSLSDSQIDYTNLQVLNYCFIDWNSPFPFIKSKSNELSYLGNELLKHSSIFANYNVSNTSFVHCK